MEPTWESVTWASVTEKAFTSSKTDRITKGIGSRVREKAGVFSSTPTDANTQATTSLASKKAQEPTKEPMKPTRGIGSAIKSTDMGQQSRRMVR